MPRGIQIGADFVFLEVVSCPECGAMTRTTVSKELAWNGFVKHGCTHMARAHFMQMLTDKIAARKKAKKKPTSRKRGA